MKFSKILGLFILFLMAACQLSKDVKSMTDEELRAYADELAHRFIISDGHVDLPYRLKENKWVVDEGIIGGIGKPVGDFDVARAKKGGLDAPFMSIYIPSSYQKKNDKNELLGGGKELADSLIDMVVGITQSYPDKFALANTPAEVEANFKSGKISFPMGMENGAPVGTDVNNVKYFFDRGIRYITLTHGKDNQICDSSYDTTRATWNGLSPFGEQVVKEMNRVGIMVDISHVDDSTFYDVMKIAKAPAIASHSSCRYFTPGFQRNMNDDMIKLLAKNGGVIQINFGASFLDSAVRANKVMVDSLGKVLKAKGLLSRDATAQAIIAQFGRHKDFFSDVEKVADHIDHVKEIAGIDHVGIGSDFDGVGDSLPEGLKDVSMFPNLIYVLLKRGYTEEDIQKICSGNVFRVWNKVIEISKQ
jgi:membrane dipeptidase